MQEQTGGRERTDEELLALSLRDPSVFSVLVGRYSAAFLRRARTILHESAAAEDAVQDTFVKIYAAASRFEKREGASFSSWAYLILRNVCFTKYQKMKRDRTASVAFSEEMEEVLPDKNERAERERLLIHEELLALVSRLPGTLRRAVLLHFIEEKPQKEVAEIEGVAPGVIRTRIHRAKAELRKLALQYSTPLDHE